MHKFAFVVFGCYPQYLRSCSYGCTGVPILVVLVGALLLTKENNDAKSIDDYG